MSALEANYDPKLDPTLALSRAVVVAERLYDRICQSEDDQARADILLLMAHLRAARTFAS